MFNIYFKITLTTLFFATFSSQLEAHSRNVHNVLLFVNRSHLQIHPFDTQHFVNTTRNVVDRFSECVDNYKRRYPHLKERFSDVVLARACGRFKVWVQHQKLPSAPLTVRVNNLTLQQRLWVQRVRKCRTDRDCFGNATAEADTARTIKKRQSGLHQALRQECRSKSRQDLQRMFAALNSIRRDQIDSRSKYNLLVFNHLPQTASSAHFGPSFLPYHRELLKQLEVSIREVDPGSSLCYWDSTLDFYLPNPADSVMWSPELFGNGRGFVTTGPSANWETTASIPEAQQTRLFRSVGTTNGAALYNLEDIDRFMAKENYEELCCYCKDPSFEILHGGIHDFVGGHMTYLASSPNDPVFFAHHTFIDYFWEQWRQQRQTARQRERDYPPDGARACGSQYNADAPMRPFPLRNRDGLQNSYRSLYSYAPTPTCQNGRCTGEFLFCNTETNRCMSKVRLGGDCAGLASFNSCHNSKCVNNRCSNVVTPLQIPQEDSAVVSNNEEPESNIAGDGSETTSDQ